jgi:hypothetical protein
MQTQAPTMFGSLCSQSQDEIRSFWNDKLRDKLREPNESIFEAERLLAMSQIVI